jgi:hypothetical protein
MAKLKSTFSATGTPKLPSLPTGSTSSASLPKPSVPKNTSGQSLSVPKAGTVVQALKFGKFHANVAASASGSQWGNLLGAASSGGASSLLSGGILSGGTLGFVGKLLSLFGGSKPAPAAPVPFVMPASRQETLNVGSSSGSSSVSLGVQSGVNAGGTNGPVYQINATPNDQATQSAQVVSIVKQALLTSSSLNDVISEI